MKRLALSLLCAAPLITSAQNATDLTVRGLLSPDACVLAVGGGGHFNYGTISSTALDPAAPTLLPIQSATLTLTCPAPTVVAVRAIDDRANTPIGGDLAEFSFGLGTNDSGQSVGRLHLRLDQIRANNMPGRVLYSRDGGGQWFPVVVAENRFHPVWLKGFGDMGNGLPLAITLMTAQLETRVEIAALGALEVNEEVPIDGSAALELVYL